MSLRQLSIQWKITLLAGLCLAGIVTLLVGLSLYRMEHSSELVKASSMSMLNEAAQSRIEAQGEVQALGIRQQFMDAYQYGHGFSRQVLFLREQAEKRFLDAFDLREDLTRQVKSALLANPQLLGLSLVFEANALDGKDELFAGQEELGWRTIIGGAAMVAAMVLASLPEQPALPRIRVARAGCRERPPEWSSSTR